VAGSLDRATDLAAALELRGYGRGVPRRGPAPRASRHSWRFAAAGIVIATLGIGARIAGYAGFEAYPRVVVDADAATLAVAVALPLLAALPLAGIGARRG
jgi:energy-coupling factor transport system permease protein